MVSQTNQPRLLQVMVVLILLTGVTLYAERLPMQFSHLSSSDGLTNSSVSSIVQDTDGFLWFGSQAGLHRYDGYGMSVYTSMPFDPDSLNHHLVQTLYFAEDDFLWIGTYAGVNILDLSDYSLHSIHADRDNPEALSDEVVTAIASDADGTHWVGTLNGLNRLEDREEGTFTRFFADPTDSGALPHNTIRALHLDASGDFWVGSYAGLSRLVTGPDGEVLFRTYTAEDGFYAYAVMDIAEDSQGILWIGTWDKGLIRFDPVTEEFTQIQIPDSNVYTLLVDPNDDIYVGTWGQGLLHYRPESDSYVHYQHDPLVQTSISHNVVYSLHMDPIGVLWVGTSGNGISRLNTNQQNYTLIDAQGNPERALSAAGVRALAELPDGDLLIGLQSEGIERYRTGEGIIARYREDRTNPNSLVDETINSILVQDDGTALIATNSGLQRFFPERESFEMVDYNPDPRGDVNEDIIYALAEDSAGNLWIGTYTRGIVRRDPDGNLTRYESVPNDPHSLSNNLVYKIYVDSRDTVWVTTNGGLNRYNPYTDKWTRYLHDPEDRSSISSNSSSAVLEDTRGRLWIGTRAGGLNLYDPLSDSFRHWTVEEGLSSNTISSLAESIQGDLLIGTANGLNVYSPADDSFQTLGEAEGLNAREFSTAVLKLEDGSVVFGAFGRLIHVKESFFSLPDIPPDTLITDIKVQNTSIIEGNVNRIESIELSFRENWLSFWFAASDYTIPE
ncbi:MAG: ligand-binding sensor domain-containing protein, partial [Spirochaeta sp.]